MLKRLALGRVSAECVGGEAALMPLFWLIRQERGCQTQAEASPRAFWRMGTEPDPVGFLWISLVGKTPPGFLGLKGFLKDVVVPLSCGPLP